MTAPSSVAAADVASGGIPQGRGWGHSSRMASVFVGGTWLRASTIACVVAVACLAGAAVPVAGARLVVLGVAAIAFAAAVAVHPPLAAYALIGVTPLVAGIDRGTLIPVLRPNEALALLVGAGLMARGVLGLSTGALPRIRIGRTDLSILLLAVTSSIVPLLWMVARRQHPESDDILYALTVWKYYAVYLIVRSSVRSEREVRLCLWAAMIAASIVAVIAVLQSLQLFGVTRVLARYYAPYGSTQALLNNRGGSTLSLPIAQADLMTFNLAIAVGFLVFGRARRGLLIVLTTVFIAGILASGEFSALIGLVIAGGVLAYMTRRIRPFVAFVPVVLGAGQALRPVIERRLSGFQTVSGLPVSWYGRLHNLQSYFWPQLFSGWTFVLGVRPAARVATSSMATGYVWIESGYTWLLWSGGIPFLLAFLYFLSVNVRSRAALARERADAVGIAALAVVVALVVVGVLMVLDPHLTYRGSADLIFSLLALASTRIPRALHRPSRPLAVGGA